MRSKVTGTASSTPRSPDRAAGVGPARGQGSAPMRLTALAPGAARWPSAPAGAAAWGHALRNPALHACPAPVLSPHGTDFAGAVTVPSPSIHAAPSDPNVAATE